MKKLLEFVAENIIDCYDVYTECRGNGIEDIPEDDIEHPLRYMTWGHEEHIDSNHVDYKCNICNDIFHDEDSIVDHLVDHWIKGENSETYYLS